MYITPRQIEPQQAPIPPHARPSAPAGGGIRINVIRSLKIHAITASLVALVTCGLGLAVILRHHAIYSATSTIYVSPNFPKTLTDDREQQYQYESYIQEEMHSIPRYDVIADALRKLPPGTWQGPQESEQSAVERLQRSLDISRVGTTYQVEINLIGSRPGRLAEIVNAVTNTYLEKAKNEEFYGRDERLQTLHQERTRLQSELDARLQEQADLAKSLGVAIVNGDGGNPFDSQLEKMRSDLNTAHGQRIQAEAQLSSIENGDPSAPNSALSAAADEIIASDPQLTALKSSLGQKRSELLGTLAGLTPNNPLRKQTEEQLAETEAALQKMQASLRAKAAARLEEKLHAEVNRAATVESRLLHDLQHATAVATTAAPKFQQSDEIKADIERLQARYNTIDERIGNLELESSSPGSVHLFQPARVPLGPEPSKAHKYLLLLFPISILLGIASAVAFDLLDPHLYTGGDIEAVMGFSPVGVLLDDREVTQLVYDECALRLAAGIDHAAHSAGVRTFVVTSIGSGAGTTTIVGNLGSTLAKLGRKTLTIDASGNTNPVAYATVNLTDATRLSDFSGDEASHSGRTELQPTVVPQPINSKILPLATSFMAKAFQELTNEYDIVLIDAAPLLTSAETEYLARFADVTILVSECAKTKKAELKRTARLLERLNVGGVAVIINKVGLLRAEKTLKKDLAEFEARINKMNLRWQPKYQRAESSPFVPYVGVEDIDDAEGVPAAREM
ncbi:MAG TPA: AAA family ATPase [Silvibacterium sp.]|nr:AAA family ATPase [Silvibacterium sp.]